MFSLNIYLSMLFIVVVVVVARCDEYIRIYI